MVTAAPAAKALLAEATRLWPNRSRASDGIVSSDAHKKQNPNSGHDLGNAADLTHDPANGCDAHGIAAMVMIREDPRVLYVISMRRIWSRARYSEGWRTYNGPNPHDKHAHFEIDPAHRDDTRPWFAINARPPLPPLHLEDDAMWFKDENDRLAWQVAFAYNTLLGRPVENLDQLGARMQQIRDKGYAHLWLDIANSAEAAAWAQKLGQ